VSPLVVLVGPPGAGKTTVGRRLATRLGVDFRDTDADVEAAAGAPVYDVFIDQGEEAFRALERAAVATAVVEHEGVLALGGGSIMDPGTRALLAPQRVVFLDVGVAQAARRVGFARDRPLLIGNPRGQWLRLMQERRPFYEEVATVTVSTDSGTPDDIVELVVARVGALS
jgi:shikimate kinase